VGSRRAGSKKSARGGSIREELESHGFLDVELRSGTRAGLDRGKPFDYFNALLQVNFVRGRGLGELRIDGNLWHRPLSDDDGVSSKLIVMQNFEYTDNTAFEFGGQSVGLQYHRSRAGAATSLEWSVGANWMLLNGVDSELSFLSDVEGIRERSREYDFGIGPGFDVGLGWSRKGLPVLAGSYGYQYQHTVNVRGLLPVSLAGFTLGVDYERLHRRSDFELVQVGVVNHWADQLQFHLSWSPQG
jgi:hypothetical protein